MKLKITQDFLFAHRGVEVKSYTAGEEVETDDEELVRVATDEGWAEPAEGEAVPPKARAKKA